MGERFWEITLRIDAAEEEPVRRAEARPARLRWAAPAEFVSRGVRRDLRVIDHGDIDGCHIRSEIAN